jgi:hypothetical protein
VGGYLFIAAWVVLADTCAFAMVVRDCGIKHEFFARGNLRSSVEVEERLTLRELPVFRTHRLAPCAP